MPLRNEPPRQPDGVGRQAIRSTPASPDGRPDAQAGDRLLVGQWRGAWLALVVVAAYWFAALVGYGWPVDGWAVGVSVGVVVAAVGVLVASRSGGRR